MLGGPVASAAGANHNAVALKTTHALHSSRVTSSLEALDFLPLQTKPSHTHKMIDAGDRLLEAANAAAARAAATAQVVRQRMQQAADDEKASLLSPRDDSNISGAAVQTPPSKSGRKIRFAAPAQLLLCTIVLLSCKTVVTDFCLASSKLAARSSTTCTCKQCSLHRQGRPCCHCSSASPKDDLPTQGPCMLAPFAVACAVSTSLGMLLSLQRPAA